MYNAKLRVIFTLPGRVLTTKLTTKQLKTKDGKNYYKKVAEKVEKPAKQVITMDVSAFLEFKSKSKPFNYKGAEAWHTQGLHKKISFHLNEMKEDLGATSFEYQILED